MQDRIKQIQTVTGPLPPEQLLHCQCHEHLFIASGKPVLVHPALCMEDEAKTVEEIMRYKGKGGRAIVDAQPVGCGRIAAALVRASLAAELPIIASTGFHKLDFYWDHHWIHYYDENRLAEIFVNELTRGMYIDGDSKEPGFTIEARAGIIKTAVGPNGITDSYGKCFEAAAAASNCTGAPIQCHMEPGVDPLGVVQFFVERGIAPASLILCHLDRTHYDLELHERVARTGVFLEYDTIGRFKYHSDDTEASLIIHMIHKGFVNQLLLSLDTTRQRLLSYGGEIGLDYILTTFLPKLSEYGVEEQQLHQMTLLNPRRALAY